MGHNPAVWAGAGWVGKDATLEFNILREMALLIPPRNVTHLDSPSSRTREKQPWGIKTSWGAG